MEESGKRDGVDVYVGRFEDNFRGSLGRDFLWGIRGCLNLSLWRTI